MGTTVTAAHVGEDMVTIAHVGDSRCYLVRDGELTRLTTDHSLVEELVRARQAHARAGRDAPAALRDHARARARAERAGRHHRAARPGRRPVHGLLGRPDVDGPRARTSSRCWSATATPLDELGRSLIAAANDAGGRDNITVILFSLEEVEAPVGPGAAGRGRAPCERAPTTPTRASTTPSPARRSPRRARASAARRGPHAPDRRAPDRGRRSVGHPGARVPRLRDRRALGGAPARAADRGGRARATAPRAARAGAQAPPARHAGPRARARLPHRPAGRLLARDAPGLLRRRRRIPRQRRHRLPRSAVRPPARDQPLLAGPALRGDAPERPAAAALDVHRPQAALQGRRREPGARSSSRAASHERPQPRADGADPGVAAGDGRVRRDLHPAQRDPLRRLADLRRDLPRRSASSRTS